MAWNPSALSSHALTSAAWQAEDNLTTGPRVMLSPRIRLLAPPPSYKEGRTWLLLNKLDFRFINIMEI